MRGVTFLIALALGAAAPAAAQTLPPGLTADAAVEAEAALDGDTLRLADGRVLRLALLLAPKPPRAREPFASWPIAERARDALAELAAGRRLRLAVDGAATDRYRRVVAHAVRDDGLWLQGALVARGFARVESAPERRAGARALLALEAEARAARRGLWALGFYRVVTPAEAGRFLDVFQIVEGRLGPLTPRRGRAALALTGADGRVLGLALTPAARRLAVAAGLDPAALQGETLRVRGWIQAFDGPFIDLTHPEQIERVSP